MRGNPPAIIWWEAGVVAMLLVVMFLPVAASVQGILVLGFFCADALLVAHVLLGRTMLGVVLTDRRLIVFRQASLRQRLRGVPFDLTGALLDVSRAHVWVQLSRQNVFSGFPGIGLMLGFDDSVGHDPIKLTFSAFNQPDGEALMFVVHDPESQRTRPLQTPPAGRNHSGAVHPSGPATGQPGDRPPDHAPSS